MADRKQFLGDLTPDPKLSKILKTTSDRPVPEEELREQRISFAYGNAPAGADRITKDSVRHTSKNIRLRS